MEMTGIPSNSLSFCNHVPKRQSSFITLKHWYDVILYSIYIFYFLKHQGLYNKLPAAVQ
jgi:hypothetical protein